MSAIVFGSPEAQRQQFDDEMDRLNREIAHLALTDDGDSWDSQPAQGKRAYVYHPADAAFPTPCKVFECRGDQVYVCLGKVGDMESELLWVDTKQVTTKKPQLALFG